MLIRSLFLFVVLSSFLQGQTTCTHKFSGNIIQDSIEMPLANVKVELLGHSPEVTRSTDDSGYFHFSGIEPGNYILQFSFIGNETIVIPIAWECIEDMDLGTIGMKSESIMLEEALIVNDRWNYQPINEFQVNSSNKIDIKNYSKIPSSFNDPARMASILASVSPGTVDAKNELIVRGNSPRNNLWRVENTDLTSPNHFSNYGATGGAVNMISGNMLKQFDFTSGSPPAEYGNALGGIFDIKLKSGNMDKYHFLFEISPIALEANTEGPFKRGSSSFILNYRYSTFALIEKMGFNVQNLETPEFQDLSYKLFFSLKNKKSYLSIFGINGLSNYIENAEARDSTGEHYTWQIETFRFNQTLNGLNFQHMFNENLNLNTTLSAVTSRSEFQQERINDSLIFNISEKNNFIDRQVKLHSFLDFSKRDNLKVRSGVILTLWDFDMSNAERKKHKLEDYKENGFGPLLQWYTSLKYDKNKFSLFAGTHFLFFGITKEVSVEPRAGFQYKPSDKHILSFSSGLISKPENIETYFFLKDSTGHAINGDVKLTKSFNNSLGYIYNISPSINLNVELYYQFLFQVPIVDIPGSTESVLNRKTGFVKFPLVNKGTGYNYGMEMTWDFRLQNGLFALCNFSAYNSKYKAMDGIVRNTMFNSNFASNLFAGYRFNFGKSKKNEFLVAERNVLAGGKRYTPLDPDLSATYQFPVEDESKAFSEKGSMYYRGDLAIGYSRTLKKVKIQTRFDIQNFTNRQNVVEVDYDPKVGIYYRKEGQLLPYLSFRIEWDQK